MLLTGDSFAGVVQTAAIGVTLPQMAALASSLARRWERIPTGRIPPVLGDLLLAFVVLAASLLPLVGVAGSQCDCHHVPAWAYLAAAGESLPLTARRIAPFWASLPVLLCTVAYGLAELPDSPIPFGAVVAIYSVSAYGRRWQSWLTAAFAAGAVALVPTLSAGHSDLLDYGNNALAVAAAWFLGDRTRSRRAYLAVVEQNARQADRERRLLAERAAADERPRISREMHDVLAHSVSLIVVQAEAGPLVADDPIRAAAVFDEIGAVGRKTLQDLRSLLGILREGRPEGLVPQPGVAEVADLVHRARLGGATVDYLSSGDLSQVSSGQGLIIYRIVQESLTNAIRHAPGSHVRLRVEVDEQQARVVVANSAPGPRGGAGTGAGAGAGLDGIRQRVRAAGGRVTAGPDAAGGWIVDARFPLRATEAAAS